MENIIFTGFLANSGRFDIIHSFSTLINFRLRQNFKSEEEEKKQEGLFPVEDPAMFAIACGTGRKKFQVSLGTRPLILPCPLPCKKEEFVTVIPFRYYVDLLFRPLCVYSATMR